MYVFHVSFSRAVCRSPCQLLHDDFNGAAVAQPAKAMRMTARIERIEACRRDLRRRCRVWRGSGVGGRGCHALGRRCPQRRAPDRGCAAGRRAVSAGRCRDQARCAAGTPIGAIPATPACRHNSISPARATSSRSTCCGRRRERMVDAGGTSIGYSAGVIFPLRIVPQEAGKPVRAAPAAAIRDLRKALRAGRRPQRADAGERPRLAGRGADRGRRPRAEAAEPGRGRRSVDPLGAARAAARATSTHRGRCRRPRRRRSVRRRTDASNGRCRCRRRSPARRPDCSALSSSSTARRPARATRARYLTLTAVAPGRGDRGHDPSRLIRRGR